MPKKRVREAAPAGDPSNDPLTDNRDAKKMKATRKAPLKAVSASQQNRALNRLFDTIRGPPSNQTTNSDEPYNPDIITPEGSEDYLQNQIGIDVYGIELLVFSQIVQCPKSGVIERQGFLKGWADLVAREKERLDEIKRTKFVATWNDLKEREREEYRKLRLRGPLEGWNNLSEDGKKSFALEAKRRVSAGYEPRADTPANQKSLIDWAFNALAVDKSWYQKVYDYSFQLAKAEHTSPGAKSAKLEDAISYWDVLFTAPDQCRTPEECKPGRCKCPPIRCRSPVPWDAGKEPWLDWWFEFLNSEWKKDVNNDLWSQTRGFAANCLQDESLSWWNDELALPWLIDEFVKWLDESNRFKIKRSNGEEEDVDME